MTTTDILVPYYARFTIGFAIVAIVFAILNFAMNIVIMITVKGIYIPTWSLVVISIMMVACCVWVGHMFEKYDIQNRIQSHLNKKMNPEINKLNRMAEDIEVIKKIMEGK